MGNHDYLNTTKADKACAPNPAVFQLQGFPYTRYNEIAAVMYPRKSIRRSGKLDAICKAFNIPL